MPAASLTRVRASGDRSIGAGPWSFSQVPQLLLADDEANSRRRACVTSTRRGGQDSWAGRYSRDDSSTRPLVSRMIQIWNSEWFRPRPAQSRRSLLGIDHPERCLDESPIPGRVARMAVVPRNLPPRRRLIERRQWVGFCRWSTGTTRPNFGHTSIGWCTATASGSCSARTGSCSTTDLRSNVRTCDGSER